MTDPDDDWGDLARELGVQKPTTPPAAAEAHAEEPEAELEPEAAEGEQDEFAEGLADDGASGDDGESDADGEGEDGPGEGEAGGEAGEGEEGQPGTGRKRRRRRRRRKKGGPEGEAGDAGIADEPAPSYQAAARVPTPVRPPAPVVARPVVAAVESDDVEADSDEGEVGGVAPAAEEDTAGEVLRELIATWNVPSWDEIISGLHR